MNWGLLRVGGDSRTLVVVLLCLVSTAAEVATAEGETGKGTGREVEGGEARGTERQEGNREPVPAVRDSTIEAGFPPRALFQDAVWGDPEETARLLAELEAAGFVMTGEEWRRLGLPASAPPPRDLRPTAAVKPWTGFVSWRYFWRPEGRETRTGRLQCAWRSLTAAFRWHRTSDGAVNFSGQVGAEWPGLRGRVGGVGLEHGLGLFCAAPGRWRSLSAATSLATGRVGGVGYSGAEDRRTVGGAMAEVSRGRWGLTILTGRQWQSSASHNRAAATFLRLTYGLGDNQVSTLVGRQGLTRGASLALRKGSTWGAVRLEIAFWRHAARDRGQAAWAVWWVRQGSGWRLEGQYAAANSEGGWLARRPAALPGWHGWGWALRGWRQLNRTTRVQALLMQGRNRRADTSTPQTARSLRGELALRFRPRMNLTCELRHRVGHDETNGWEDRYPWLPPQTLREKNRSQSVVLVALRRQDWELHISGRTLAERQSSAPESTPEKRRRSLVAMRVDWQAMQGWLLRVGWASAWGDDLDLVSVASILPGYVVPRHWGRWATESHVGLARRTDRWRLQAGITVRQPVLNSGMSAMWEAMARASTSW